MNYRLRRHSWAKRNGLHASLPRISSSLNLLVIPNGRSDRKLDGDPEEKNPFLRSPQSPRLSVASKCGARDIREVQQPPGESSLGRPSRWRAWTDEEIIHGTFVKGTKPIVVNEV